LPDPGQHGPRASRIYVEVLALEPVAVRAIDVLSDTPPERRATLSIGLCTFNQEAYFATTLDRLTRLADRLPSILRIHVVNQGKPFASPAILKHLENPKVRLVEQRNLGGCGGFTRSLVEELAEAEPASHHLMMDDDIVLDERMIERALRFLDYARSDIALGAGMLDALRPSVMYEAGAFLRANNTIEPYCHNVDLADPDQLWRFNAPVPTDYNAWWFCILPVERARALALPAPIFIRGDDFEYGQRMARAGIPTITLPGIGIWHEPFYAKPSGWQEYYDLRNRLIFAACYSDRVRQLSLAHVAGLITTSLLVHNYPSARLRLKAVADFLKGPKALFGQDTEALHAEVMALGKRDAPERLGSDWTLSPPAGPGKPRPESMRALVVEQARALLRNAFLPHRRGEELLLDIDARPPRVAGRAYVMTNGMRSYHLRFIPKRGALWSLTARTVTTLLRFRVWRGTVGREWAASISTYRDPAWWSAHWDRPKGQPVAKDAAGRQGKP
jgi:galactofuranosylgalactofuranosylrhamnosyl-N-acetylglucosaminyl-diphospho-decaprenol beta-1,5/1,6-galactofuranosyltransferase